MHCRVLLLESDPKQSRNVADYLAGSGVHVDAASSLDEARARLRSAEYDLLFLDATPADGDGLRFAEDLRAEKIGTPFVITSARDSAEARMAAESSRAAAFLAKPYAMSELNSLIRSVAPGASPPGGRVLMYSHDTIGLGHMRRNSNIAAYILRQAPDASVLMTVGSPAGFVFDMPDGLDFIKLPSLAKDGRRNWRPGSLRTGPEPVRALRAALIRQTVETFQPDVFLVDHAPLGVWGELTEALQALRVAHWRPHVVLGLRDILDDPDQVRRNFLADGVPAAIRDYYDEIFVYGDPGIYDGVKAYGLEELAPGRVSYCGYAAMDRPAPSAPQDPDGPPRLLISGGGGRDAYPMMTACVDALSRIEPDHRPAATLVGGPLMDPGLRKALRLRVDALGFRYADMLSDYAAELAKADMLVCMGGYNSIVEALNLGVPTLVVPRMGPSAEQQTRARLFSERGLVTMITPDRLDPVDLAERFSRIRRADAQRRPLIAADGAETAAARILRVMARPETETALSA